MGEHRVVILARDGELTSPDPQSLPQPIRFVRTASGYEAAAELLSSPTLAILIDLPCLTPRHRKLLQIARSLGVEILGVGEFPAGFSAADLSGMRLISMEDLPTILRAILPRPASPPPAPPKPAVHLAPARKAEYRTELSTQTRPSRIIPPAGIRREEPNSSGRTER